MIIPRIHRRLLGFWLLVAIGLIVAAIAGAGMVNDGSYYFIRTLEHGFPFIPNRRMIHDPTGRLLLLAANFTTDLGVLQGVFGLGYVVIPLISLWGSWWVVRKQDRGLFLWAAFATLIAPLPAQFAFIAESAHTVQFMVPLVMAVLVPPRNRNIPILIFFGALAFFTNPVSILLFGGLTVLSFIVAIHYREQRRERLIWTAVIGVVTVIGLARFALQINSYEAEQLTLTVFWNRFIWSFWGVPLLAMILAWLCGMFLLKIEWIDKRFPKARRIAAALLLAAGMAFLIRVLVPALWANLLDYRFFVQFSVVPFFGWALIDSLNRDSGRTVSEVGDWSFRLGLIQGIGLIFGASLAIQSLWWHEYTNRLWQMMAESRTACIQIEDPQWEWIQSTPMNHWSITAYSLIMQGHTPSHVMIKSGSCAPDALRAGVNVEDKVPHPWDVDTVFDLRTLRDRVLAGK